MTDLRHRWRAGLPVVVGLLLAGCTTTTLNPTTGLTPVTGVAVSAEPVVPDGTDEPPSAVPSDAVPSDAVPSDPVTTDVPTSIDPPASSDPVPTAAPTLAPTVATYTPPPDAEATAGDCPYLTKDQVQADTGQRIGTTRTRAAAPAPVCEFVRSDDGFLATVRVLQLDTDATAVAAVDFYVPRDTSNPESRPAGWTGGSLATDDGSTYGVSKGTYAVIAATNQKQSVYARLLVVHAIESLGL